MLFFIIWSRKENRKGKKIREKVFPPEPTFFILPNWEENEEWKVMRNAFDTNTPFYYTHLLLLLSHYYITRT